MKSTFKIAIFLCLIVCVLLLAISCNQKDETLETTNQETTTSEEDFYPEPIKQLLAENKPYSLEFVSNGDGTCYVAGIGTCTDTDIVIPSTSPEG